MRIAFHTLGCKLNFSESSALADNLVSAGFEHVSFEGESDIYIINTCSVTENADKKCAAVVRKCLRKSPDAFMVIIGCYAQLKPAEIAGLPGVDLVLGAAEKFRLAEHLSELRSAGKILKSQNGNSCGVYKAGKIEDLDFFSSARSLGERTRCFLKVQDGCDYSCSFCTIPLARGHSRSGTITQIVEAARQAADRGVREIILTGVNIGDFGRDPKTGRQTNGNFEELILALDQTAGIERFRISSIEPNLLTDSIIQIVSESRRFAPHFHMPLQSGSNRILGLMKRRYRRELYEQKVEVIKKHMPHAAIGADVIVGFPGETDADFSQTHQFLSHLDVTYLHVFPYSERDNTVAKTMQGSVPRSVRQKRSAILRNLSINKRQGFQRQFKGEFRKVLFEADNKEGMMHGFTDNYIKVAMPFDSDRINSLEMVQIPEYS